MTTWTGGMLDDGGVAWNKYLETPNATYGAHADAVTFWNREQGDCLRIQRVSLLTSAATQAKDKGSRFGGRPHMAMRFSHQPSGDRGGRLLSDRQRAEAET